MRHLILTLALSLAAVPAAAQNWALGGYDPVGYASDGRAIPGRSDIATMWQGQLWHFASEENRARFEADPRAFEPAFDGNCVVSLAEGRRERGDPRHFALLGGTLYLARSGQAEQELRQDPNGIIERARAAWPRLK